MRSALIIVAVALVGAGCSAEEPRSSKDCAEASRFVRDAHRAYIEVNTKLPGETDLLVEARKAYEVGKYWRTEACIRLLPPEFWSDAALKD